jgi:ATP-dependent DNA ligase
MSRTRAHEQPPLVVFGPRQGTLAVMLPRIAPMKAVTGDLPPPGDAWAAEVKFDGQRLGPVL